MASPYYVEPLGGYDIGRGLTGLSESMAMRRREDREEEERRIAMEATEAAKQKFAQAKAAAMEAYRSGDPDQIAQTMMAFPEVAGVLNQSIGFKNKATRDNMLESLRIGIVSPDRIPELIRTRSEFVRSQGGDPAQTEAEVDRYNADPEQYVEKLKSTWAALDFPSYNTWRQSTDPQGFDPVEKQQFLPGGLTQQSHKSGKVSVITAAGKRLIGDEALQAIKDAEERGVELSRRGAGERARAGLEARLELAPQVERAEAGASTAGKTQAERSEAAIDAGISAAEQLPTINRALELLEQVQTGGWAGAAKSVSDFLGTTSEDVGELNALLGQAIVGSLRSTFGGNPTEGERAALAKIQASISQGKGVNKALLQNALTLAKVRLNRGKRAAERAGDEEALQAIEELMNVRLEGPASRPEQPAQQPKVLRYNPATGRLE